MQKVFPWWGTLTIGSPCCLLPRVSSAVALSTLTEVLNALIRDLRALQTPAINWGLPEKPMVVGGWATVNLRTLAPKGILHGHQRWSL